MLAFSTDLILMTSTTLFCHIITNFPKVLKMEAQWRCRCLPLLIRLLISLRKLIQFSLLSTIQPILFWGAVTVVVVRSDNHSKTRLCIIVL